MKKHTAILMIVALLAVSLFVGCQKEQDTKDNNLDDTKVSEPKETATAEPEAKETKPETKDITVILDWVPNTNHTGLYVALEEGYFEEEGLNVEIIQPTEGGSADLIAAGQGEFGISYQEQVTYARTKANPLPVKAIAAIIQHNTSGFASAKDKNIIAPKDFEGKKYGGWGSPMEEAMLKGLMARDSADYEKLEIVSVGAIDFFTSVTEHVDFAWIYYGWDGIASELKEFPINFIRLQDVEPNLDSYTPLIVANEKLLEEDPDLAKRFLNAVTKGYEFAIEKPEEAAEHLLKNAPEVDREIAIASQKYLAKEYKSGTEKWGEMQVSMWENYAKWMLDMGLIESELDAKAAFTNEYLPK